MSFHPSESFDIKQMGAFMRRPDIYGALTDALAPPAEAVQFEDYMVQPTTWTVACMWEEHIVGYVQLVTRTSVAAEAIAGFYPATRGLVAKRFIEYVIKRAWTERGLLVIWVMIPSDNLPARRMVSEVGFSQEARLRKAMTRVPVAYRGVAKPPGLYDLVVYSLYKPQGN